MKRSTPARSQRTPLRTTSHLVLVLLGVLVIVCLPARAVVGDPGDLDTTFSEDGVAKVFTKGSVGTGVTVDGRGRVVVVGYTLGEEVDVAVARFLRNGSLDPAFGDGDGRVRLDLGGTDHAFDVALVPGGGMVIAGARTTPDADVAFVVRLGGRGRPLPSFGRDGLRIVDFGRRYQAAEAISITADGNYVIGGWISNGTASRSAFARLLPDGAVDRAFSGDGRVAFNLSPGAEQMRDVLVLPNGKILGAGEAEVGTRARFALVRVLPDGSLDVDFGRGPGRTLTDLGPGADSASALARRADGRIVLAGASGDDWGVARYFGGGMPDGSFGAAGEVVLAFTDSPEAAKDVIATGLRTLLVGTSRGASSLDLVIVRLKDSGLLDGTFGDGGVASIDVSGTTDAGSAGALAPGRRLAVVGETWVDGLPRMLTGRALLA